MKLIINIPETPLYRDMYTAICENGYIFDEDNEYIAKAIKNGTPIPDNVTNIDDDNKYKYPYTGKEEKCPCPCGARGEACMTCPWE